MLKYPKQNKEIGEEHQVKFLMKDGEVYIYLDLFILRVDNEDPKRIIGICKNKGEYENYIFDIYQDPSVNILPDVPEDDIRPDIQVARYNGNTVYMIPVNTNYNHYIYIMVVDGKYLQFYSQLDQDNDLIYLDYEYLNNMNHITIQDIYDFIEQLTGEYNIWKD